MYPSIEPHETGLLDVGDGNHVHWETSGNPEGKPALHRAWPGAELIVVEEGGHLATAATREHLLHALDRFAA